MIKALSGHISLLRDGTRRVLTRVRSAWSDATSGSRPRSTTLGVPDRLGLGEHQDAGGAVWCRRPVGLDGGLGRRAVANRAQDAGQRRCGAGLELAPVDGRGPGEV